MDEDLRPRRHSIGATVHGAAGHFLFSENKVSPFCRPIPEIEPALKQDQSRVDFLMGPDDPQLDLRQTRT